MSEAEKLRVAIIALRRIAKFGHTDDCDCISAPVYECGCYDESQWDIARKALSEMGEE